MPFLLINTYINDEERHSWERAVESDEQKLRRNKLNNMKYVCKFHIRNLSLFKLTF